VLLAGGRPAAWIGLVLVALGSVVAWRAHGRAGAWAELPAWARVPRAAAGFAVRRNEHRDYLVLVDRLGFVLTGSAYLAALMLVQIEFPRLAVPLAVVLTLVVHAAFYKLLRVPLPWGVLQPVAW